VVRDPKAAKKPYSPPSFHILDADAAKAELEATGASSDVNGRRILSVLNQPRDGKPSPGAVRLEELIAVSAIANAARMAQRP
jgi:hypothetical protein